MNDRLQMSMIGPDASVGDAMRSLEASMTQVVLVVDAARRLLGTLTDGDLRRAMLRGTNLETPIAPHMNRDFYAAPSGSGRAEILDLMQARQLLQVPVVDSNGRVCGLHLLREMLGQRERPNWAVIMAGGRGQRLAPLTDSLPKPMIPIAGRPILERIVLHLVGNGMRRVFLSVNYMADVIQRHFGDGERFGCRIEYLRESAPLGTGGALSLLPERPTEPLIVMNGDLLTQANLGGLLDFHENGAQAVTMGVRRHSQPIPFGCVEVVGDELVGFTERPTVVHLINTGICAVAPRVLEAVERGESVSMPEVVERVKRRGEVIKVFEIAEDWIDIGRSEDLERARGLA